MGKYNTFLKAIRIGDLKQIQKLANTVNLSAYYNFAIRLASENGHLEIVQFLTSLNNVDPTDVRNYAIRIASENGHLDVVKFLARLPHVDISDCDNLAIQSANIKGRLNVVEYLYNHSSKENQKAIDKLNLDSIKQLKQNKQKWQNEIKPLLKIKVPKELLLNIELYISFM